MKRSLLLITAFLFLIAAESVLTVGAQESKDVQVPNKKHPLLSRLDIPLENLPKGCSKPDLQPSDFPIRGLRQCAITTDARPIAAMDERATKVGAKNIDAMYYAVYREAGELGVVGLAFSHTAVAKNAYNNLLVKDNGSRVWRRGKYVIWVWQDRGTSDQCMQQMEEIIGAIVRRHDSKDD